jgi:hypothetical protein
MPHNAALLLSLAALLATVLPAQPQAPVETATVVEHSEGRMVVSVGVAEGRFTVRLAHDAIIHGVRFELATVAGEPLFDLPWEATLAASTVIGTDGTMALLDDGRPELRVPRPYGLRFGAADSMTISHRMKAETGAEGAILRLTIEYERPAVRVSRLPVVALALRAPSGNDAVDTWTWQPDVDGRLVAISGRELVGAESIVLEDATTGAVLWHTEAQRTGAGDAHASAQGELIRPSITLQQGRSYRLRALFSGARPPRGASAPLAVLVPSLRRGE